jgi:murein DD-endopeptidase MepM/ murein hydrolase activator NlpD
MSTIHSTFTGSVPDAPRRFRLGRRCSSTRAMAGLAVVIGASALAVPTAVDAAPVGRSTSTCASAGLGSHLVVSGDTWFEIAQAAEVSMRSLLDTNDASQDHVLHPGDVVCLPQGAALSSSCSPSNAPTYTVESGDTWWHIASRAGVSMSRLLSTNSASQERVIHPGQTVCLPPGSSASTSVSTAASRSSASSGATSNGASSSASAGLAALPMRGPCWFSDSWGDPQGGGRRHEGTDLFAAPKSYVYAVVDGTLTRRAWDQPGLRSGNAWWLTAADGSGTYYFYAHLADFAPELSVGSRVEAGQIIGFMGNTGNSAFPHLHFEIHPNGGAAVNPYAVLRQSGGCKTGEQYRQPGGWVPD